VLNWIEQRISNPVVAGSIAAAATTIANPSRSVLLEESAAPMELAERLSRNPQG
jgi:hypothetical protein